MSALVLLTRYIDGREPNGKIKDRYKDLKVLKVKPAPRDLKVIKAHKENLEILAISRLMENTQMKLVL